MTSEPRKVTLNARPSPWHMSDHMQGSGLGPDYVEVSIGILLAKKEFSYVMNIIKSALDDFIT